MSLPLAPVRFRSKKTEGAPSLTDRVAAANSTSGIGSSSKIVRVARVCPPRLAPTGGPRVSSRVSVASWIESWTTVTARLPVRVRAGIITRAVPRVASTPSVAVPLTMIGTRISWSLELDSVSSRKSVPAASGTESPAVVHWTEGVGSSSVIVIAALWFPLGVAPVGVSRVIVIVSSSSSQGSLIAVIVIVARVAPAGITIGDAVAV